MNDHFETVELDKELLARIDKLDAHQNVGGRRHFITLIMEDHCQRAEDALETYNVHDEDGDMFGDEKRRREQAYRVPLALPPWAPHAEIKETLEKYKAHLTKILEHFVEEMSDDATYIHSSDEGNVPVKDIVRVFKSLFIYKWLAENVADREVRKALFVSDQDHDFNRGDIFDKFEAGLETKEELVDLSKLDLVDIPQSWPGDSESIVHGPGIAAARLVRSNPETEGITPLHSPTQLTVTLPARLTTMIDSVARHENVPVDKILHDVLTPIMEESIMVRTHFKLNEEDSKFFNEIIGENTHFKLRGVFGATPFATKRSPSDPVDEVNDAILNAIYSEPNKTTEYEVVEFTERGSMPGKVYSPKHLRNRLLGMISFCRDHYDELNDTVIDEVEQKLTESLTNDSDDQE